MPERSELRKRTNIRPTMEIKLSSGTGSMTLWKLNRFLSTEKEQKTWEIQGIVEKSILEIGETELFQLNEPVSIHETTNFEKSYNEY
jgi:hypothetical protein